MTGPEPSARQIHATCVAYQGKGLLILGPSGSGKSALALQLMALGADLVADDRTDLTRKDDRLIASCPVTLSGKIEARGVGILRAVPAAPTDITLIVDLGQSAPDRLPPQRDVTLLGLTRDLVCASQSDHFAAAILCYLKQGRLA